MHGKGRSSIWETKAHWVKHARGGKEYRRRGFFLQRCPIHASRRRIVAILPSSPLKDHPQFPEEIVLQDAVRRKPCPLTTTSKMVLYSTHNVLGNTIMRQRSDDCLFQSELSVGFSRDRQVRASETADRRLVSTNSSMTNLSSSSISKTRCGMGAVVSGLRCEFSCGGVSDIWGRPGLGLWHYIAQGPRQKGGGVVFRKVGSGGIGCGT